MKRLIFKTDLQNEIDYHLQQNRKEDIIKVLDISNYENSSVYDILIGIKQIKSHVFDTITFTTIREELYSVNGEISLVDIEFFKNVFHAYFNWFIK